MSELRFAQLQARGEVSPILARRASAASRADPLAYEPFLFAAAMHFPGQRSVGSDAAVPLIEEALRRNPRSRQARTLALRHAIGEGRIDRAIANIRELHRIDPGTASRLVENVGKMVVTRPQLDASLDELSRHDVLVEPFVRGFLSAPKSPDLIVRLAQGLPRFAVERSQIGSALIGGLVRSGRFDTARDVWRVIGGRPGKGLVSDPTFTATGRVPPFDWELTQSASGVAEAQDGGLFVDYYGRLPGPLVRQLVTLVPGSYRAVLSFKPLEQSAGSIALRVTCAAENQQLASRTIAVTATARTTLALPFAVPAGCDGQYLELAGLPNEGRTGQQLLVQRLHIIRGWAQ